MKTNKIDKETYIYRYGIATVLGLMVSTLIAWYFVDVLKYMAVIVVPLSWLGICLGKFVMMKIWVFKR